MNRVWAEAIGTFSLVFAGTGAIVINDVSHGAITHVGIAFTFGLVVMSMIYAVGPVSGAHLNPAVTLGFYLAGRFPGKDIFPYISSQLAGAMAAVFLLRLLFLDHPTLGATLPAGPWWQSFVLEVMLTCILMFVILQVSLPVCGAGPLAAVAIGGVVGLAAMFAGPVCGASMNPARSLAPALVSGNWTHLWIYLVAPSIGAVAGTLLQRQINLPVTPPDGSAP